MLFIEVWFFGFSEEFFLFILCKGGCIFFGDDNEFSKSVGSILGFLFMESLWIDIVESIVSFVNYGILSGI